MSRNIELKCRIENLEDVTDHVVRLADRGPIEILQDDTFFVCHRGRLKLREFSATEGELIFYRRADEAGPKESFYVLHRVDSPAPLRELLTLALGQAGRVRKHRTLYLSGRTRIHLDRVEGLGTFLELEVVLEGDEPAERGVAEAYELIAALGLGVESWIHESYRELLAAGRIENQAP